MLSRLPDDINSFTKAWFKPLILVLAAPLFVFGVSDQIDWDVDWAQYIDQAVDRLNGAVGAAEIINHDRYGPLFKGAGFSLILMPVYGIFGLYIPPYLILQVLCLTLASIFFGFILLKDARIGNRSVLIVLAVLAILYNYQLARLKIQISPEFPYMAASFAALYFFQIRKSFIVSAILIGLSISIRDIGWTLYIACIASVLLNRFQAKLHITWMQLGYIVALPVITLSAIELFMFESTFLQRLWWYTPHFNALTESNTILDNLYVYAKQIQYLFEQEIWGWFNTGLLLFIAVALPIGIISAWRRVPKTTDLYFVFYIAALMAYQYNLASMRFLIPAFPIIIYYLLLAVVRISKLSFFLRPLPEILLLLIVMSNYINTKSAFKTQINNGPRSQASREAWAAIADYTPHQAIIVSRHPLVTHLYTERSGYTWASEEQKQRNISEEKNIDFLLFRKEWMDKDFNATWLSKASDTSLIWQNSDFELIKLK